MTGSHIELAGVEHDVTTQLNRHALPSYILYLNSPSQRIAKWCQRVSKPLLLKVLVHLQPCTDWHVCVISIASQVQVSMTRAV
jgi:hypothetical protein